MDALKEILDFEKLLMNTKTNELIEALIEDNAFTTEFLASTIAHYFCSVLKGGE